MGKTLTEIAKQLKDANKKVQLIYAFNGTGKTRLSREFKQLIAPKADGSEGEDEAGTSEVSRNKILYYNAFTEDLFYWDNDLALDAQPRLRIQPNSFTDWLLTILRDMGQDGNIIQHFQHYTNDKLTPNFNEDFSEVTFSLARGDDDSSKKLKISKGEESCFIWSIFYTLLDQVISTRNIPEPEDRETQEFDQLEYIFIDDPVSSLDENHLIELAVNLASLIKSSESNLKFIVSTHSPLFYNVLFNELKGKTCYMLERFEDGNFTLTEKYGDSNKNFSYHLHLKHTIEQAIVDNKIERFHFTLLRNLYEKTASFLGYRNWSALLPDDQQLYLGRILNFTSHSTLSNETAAGPTPAEKAMIKRLLDHLKSSHRFWQEEGQND
ncbi:AAA family ATPase [Zymobacter sp. IVIA_12111.31 C1]|uniref:AAA family ATPase n=1 Tax=Zymobacter sp. IVIA_12111.31 C1 TaxID=3394854 RepID=UPI0039C36F02